MTWMQHISQDDIEEQAKDAENLRYDASMTDVCGSQLLGLTNAVVIGEGEDSCIKYTKDSPLVTMWHNVGHFYQTCHYDQTPGVAQAAFDADWNIEQLAAAITNC